MLGSRLNVDPSTTGAATLPTPTKKLLSVSSKTTSTVVAIAEVTPIRPATLRLTFTPQETRIFSRKESTALVPAAIRASVQCAESLTGYSLGNIT